MDFKYKLPISNVKRNDFNLSHNHVLTHNFGIHNIISTIDVKRGDDITIDLSAYTRLTPLPCPTYGGIKITHRAFAVNFDFIIKNFSHFISFDKTPSAYFDVASYIPHLQAIDIPYFYASDVLDYIVYGEVDGQSVGLCEEVTANVRWDFKYGSKYYKYTNKGRRIVNWLAQLGYIIPNNGDQQNYLMQKYDCLALFAFWKYYLDWVVPARFAFKNPDFQYIYHFVDCLDTVGTSYHLTYSATDEYSPEEINIGMFLKVPTSFLDDDLYTTAFDTPYAFDSSLVDTNISGLSYASNPVSSPEVQSTPGLAQTQISNQRINQISLMSLGHLQKLVNAKKITSQRVLDFLRSECGITPSADSLRLSKYLGKFDSQIMVGDVMATATTDVNNETTFVGQYAGKGLGGSNAKWRFKCDFTGIIFITAEISTKSSYVNGISPLRSRFNPLDFYHPEFDNVGVRAIRMKELCFNTFDIPSNSSYADKDSIFGFTPRYSEYKFKNDMVTGDFMFPSVNLGLDSWYLSRKFKYGDRPVIGLEFCSATSDSVGSQYDRIFQNQNNIDHFYSVYHIGIHETSLMEKLFDYFKTLSGSDKEPDTEVSIN